MAAEEVTCEMIEYRVLLVQPDSRKVLALGAIEGYCLPCVRIPQWTRPARELQKAILATWKLHVILLDLFFSSNGTPFCAAAEILISDPFSNLKPVKFEQLETPNLSDHERAQLVSLLGAGSLTSSPFSQLGWINEAVEWVEYATHKKLLSKHRIEQYNAGGAFSLIRFPMEGDRCYWLKAAGEPNSHEFSVTRILSEIGGIYLPEMISFRPDWNAWLMSGETGQATELSTDSFTLFRVLEEAVVSMAELQMKTQGHTLRLLNAGAFDQGTDVFLKHSEALFDYLEEAMSFQTSTKALRLERPRLQELRTIFEDVCRRMEDLDLPETIMHGDMNAGNILCGCGHTQFIDWCEAYVGNPLITLQHLLLFNKAEHPEVRAFINSILKDRYKNVWLPMCDPSAMDKGFVYMPLLAAASSLYGRCDWLTTSKRDDPRRHAYARNLTRHMDQAARSPDLLETLRARSVSTEVCAAKLA